jgi:hypothetical protein
MPLALQKNESCGGNTPEMGVMQNIASVGGYQLNCPCPGFTAELNRAKLQFASFRSPARPPGEAVLKVSQNPTWLNPQFVSITVSAFIGLFAVLLLVFAEATSPPKTPKIRARMIILANARIANGLRGLLMCNRFGNEPELICRMILLLV